MDSIDQAAMNWFKPGMAVFHIRRPTSMKAPFTFTPAVVLRVFPARKHCWVRVSLRRLSDNKTIVTTPSCVTWRAYCETCSLPAHGAETPVCPSCGEQAIDKPPPLDLVHVWAPEECKWFMAVAARGALLENKTRAEIYADYSQQSKQFKQAAQLYRPDEDELREAIDLRIRILEAEIARRARERAWTPPADDQTPDGADDFTRWLEGQFTRKAA